jgi:hypothetical protein
MIREAIRFREGELMEKLEYEIESITPLAAAGAEMINKNTGC